MNIRNWSCVGAACLSLCTSPLVFASSGGVPVYVDDGVAPRCINRSTDTVWLTLRRLIITKPPDGWFLNQTDMAVYLNPTISTTAAKAPTFPLLTKVAYGDAPKGQVSLPIEYTLVDSFNLKQGSTTYLGIQLDITLLNENSRNSWGQALTTLASLTKKLPIPATNPYVEGAGYLLDFTNSLIDNDIKTLTKKNAQDIAKSGSLSFSFSPDSTCTGDFAHTGTAAIVESSGPPGTGHVDIDHLTSYCFTAQLRPIFILKEAANPAQGDCSALPAGSKYDAVTNNYAALFLNAVKTPTTLAGLSAQERTSAETRCTNNGYPKDKCLSH